MLVFLSMAEMTRACNFVGVLLLISFFPLNDCAHFLKVFPESPNTTFVTLGDKLILNVTYTYFGSENVGFRWKIRPTTGPVRNLAERIRGGSPEGIDPRASLEGAASLILRNTTFSDNGTFEFEANSRTFSDSTKFPVIIQVSPVANIICNSSLDLTEGENFLCNCTGKDGSPPPSAYWLENNKKIGSVGYLNKELTLTNVNKSHSGTYICRAKSGILIDEKGINITVFYKPTYVMLTSNVIDNTVEIGGRVMLTCIADGNPSPKYSILLNGTTYENNTGSVLVITNASYGNNGTYTCHAVNRLGSARMNLTITVTGRVLNPSTLSPSSTISSSSGNSEETSSGSTSTIVPPDGHHLNTVLIVVILAGVLSIIILIVLIAWCFFRRSRRGKEGETDSAAVPAAGNTDRSENLYVSVAEYKNKGGAEDGGAGSIFNNASTDNAGSSLLPDYAVVDRSKKTKKAYKKDDSLSYASLDQVALQPDTSKIRKRDHKETDYAAIDLDKLKKSDV